ncbi:ATPK2 [Scenedesmus sp. PABB004]|nr:ATPK2 [Scenedesmus sp. PABB004]
MLNAHAPAWAPGPPAGGVDAGAVGAAGGGKPAPPALVVISAAAGKLAAKLASAPGGGAGGDDLPTPGSLATAVSDTLTFDDVFDHGSRRGSLAEALSGVEEETGDDEADASQDGAGRPSRPGSSCSAGSGAGGPRSTPVPIAAGAAPRAASPALPAGGGGAAAGAPCSAAEAAAVAAAQRDLLADAACVSAAAVTDASQPKLGPQDFEILRVVGQGAFGKVFQVRARSSGRVYAMKVMRKARILQRDHGDYVRAERDLLTAVVHPYIVTLRYSFQTPSKLYLVLDFINGGHLFFNLYRAGVFDEDVARLYAAEIVAALTYLHGRGIVHRDLKPENVLLDSDGHVRLTDFGLAKGDMDGDSRTNSFIGTMEYMAPEIVAGAGHGRGVDWWSAGILLYEMLAGQPPFRAKSRAALQQQILTSKPKYPKFLSSAALSLLKGLLVRDPAQRLGCGPGGAEEVRRHPFFKAISWERLEARQVESRFKPGVKCSLVRAAPAARGCGRCARARARPRRAPTPPPLPPPPAPQSVENFDKMWTEQRPVDSPCGTPTDPAAAGAFEGFTYVAPSFVHSHMAALAAAKAGAGAATAPPPPGAMSAEEVASLKQQLQAAKGVPPADALRQFLRASREARLRNCEDVGIYGSTLLTHYKHKLAEEELWLLHEQVGVALLECGRLAAALPLVKAVLLKFPDSIRARRLQGMYYEAQGQLGRAKQLYEEIMTTHPHNEVIPKQLATLHRSSGELPLAIEVLRTYLDHFQNDREAWEELADAYTEAGMYGQAAFCLEEVLTLGALSPCGLVRYADTLASLGGAAQLRTARAYYAKALALSGGRSARALYGLVAVANALPDKDAGPPGSAGQELPREAAAALVELYARDAPAKLPLVRAALARYLA